MSRLSVQHRLEQRGKILHAAATLIASEGFHGMSMRRLAKVAGVSLANVYNYFASKEDILFALQKESFENLLETTGSALAGVGDAVGRLYGLISHHVHYFAEHPEVMRTLVYEAASLPDEQRRVVRRLKEQYFEIGRDIVRDLVGNGCDEPGATGRQVGRAELERITYSVFGMLNWIYGWYQPSLHGSPRQLARTIHEIALCGLVANGPHHQVQERMEARLTSLAPPPLVGLGAERPTT